jgi:hypothetical protein
VRACALARALTQHHEPEIKAHEGSMILSVSALPLAAAMKTHVP